MEPFGDRFSKCLTITFSSSEDEIDILLHGTEKQRQKLMQRRSQRQRKESSSEDEFEKQMSNELNSTVQLVEAAHSRSFNESFSVTDQGADLANKSGRYQCYVK